MAEISDIECAQLSVAELLENLGIQQVICVDDVYAQRWTLDDVQAAQQQLAPEGLQQLMPEIGATVPADRDARREKFRQVWEALEGQVRVERAERILTAVRSQQANGEDDSGDALILEQIIGKDRVKTLSPSAWEKEEPQVISTATQGGTLVLFDQDLTRDGGSPTGGMTLVQNLLGKDTAAKVLCGLLTHTATIENQHERWDELVRTSGVPRDRFIVVAKGWLGRDPLGFARMLKLVALSPKCGELKAKVKGLLGDAAAKAAEQIEAISVFDFDHIVFRTSYEEGMWEPDTLFRLHGIFHRKALRQMAHGDTELGAIVEQLRKVSHIPTDANAAPVPTSWAIQRLDLYEEAEYINGMYLPLEIGDIFQKTSEGSTKMFILVGQPCDLMVRFDGKRGPEATDVVLAEIVVLEEKKEFCVPLLYFGDGPESRHYVRLRPVHVVHPWVLDLCVLNADGVAKLDLSSQCPTGLTPAWRARYAFLRKCAEHLLRKYQTFGEGKANNGVIEAAFRQEAVRRFPPSASNSRLFKGSVDLREGVQCITFNCRRVRRLCRPRAVALAMQYAGCFSRPAFEHDLGRRVTRRHREST